MLMQWRVILPAMYNNPYIRQIMRFTKVFFIIKKIVISKVTCRFSSSIHRCGCKCTRIETFICMSEKQQPFVTPSTYVCVIVRHSMRCQTYIYITSLWRRHLSERNTNAIKVYKISLIIFIPYYQYQTSKQLNKFPSHSAPTSTLPLFIRKMRLSFTLFTVLTGLSVGVLGAVSPKCRACYEECDTQFKMCVRRAQTSAQIKSCFDQECLNVSGLPIFVNWLGH